MKNKIFILAILLLVVTVFICGCSDEKGPDDQVDNTDKEFAPDSKFETEDEPLVGEEREWVKIDEWEDWLTVNENDEISSMPMFPLVIEEGQGMFLMPHKVVDSLSNDVTDSIIVTIDVYFEGDLTFPNDTDEYGRQWYIAPSDGEFSFEYDLLPTFDGEDYQVWVGWQHFELQ